MALATLHWPSQTLTRDTKGWKASLVWKSSGVYNEIDAMNAPVNGSTPPIPSDINASHYLNAQLKCKTIVATRSGWGLWDVKADYETPSDGDSHGTITDPLKQPPRIKWAHGHEAVEMDRDVYGNPIVNSARESLSKAISETITSRFLTIIRNEPFYNELWALSFENTTNAEFWRPAGTSGFAPGTVKCVTIIPNGDYTVGVVYIPVEYQFEIRKDGWKRRLADIGRQATTADSDGNVGLGAIYTAADPKGKLTSEDIRLDGTGAPIAKTWRVGSEIATVGAYQSWGSPPPGAELEKTDSAAFLKWRTLFESSFANLGL